MTPTGSSSSRWWSFALHKATCVACTSDDDCDECGGCEVCGTCKCE